MAEPIGAAETREDRLARIERQIADHRVEWLKAVWDEADPREEPDIDRRALVIAHNEWLAEEKLRHEAEVNRLLGLHREVANGRVFTAVEQPRPSHL